jgi:molecular chaperone DnaJ
VRPSYLTISVEVLDVTNTATQGQIRRAYLEKVKVYHPDVNKDESAAQIFSEINEAHETLFDEERRKIYDKTGLTAMEQDAKARGSNVY